MSLKFRLMSAALLSVTGFAAFHAYAASAVSDATIVQQRASLANNTDGKGFGPQSPRDIDTLGGTNTRAFAEAPSYTQMNLCNIHFHVGAEHKGGEFNTYIGNGDGKGHGTGYKYSGTLSTAELKSIGAPIGDKGHGGLVPGDTIEVH